MRPSRSEYLWLLAAACSSSRRESTVEKDALVVAVPATQAIAPDIILVVLQSTRGSGTDLEQAEAKLVDGIGITPTMRFSAAYSQATHPFPSLGSLFTGRYPAAVPICSLTPEGADDPGVRPWCARLPETRRTMAEVLSLYGYRTAFFSTGLAGSELLAPGFGIHEVIAPKADVATDWDNLTARAAAWWNEDPASPRLLTVVTADMKLEGYPGRIEEIERKTDQKKLDDGEPPAPRGGSPDDRKLGKGRGGRLDRALLRDAYADLAQEAGGHIRGFTDALRTPDRPTWTFVTGSSGITLGERWGWENSPIGPFHNDIVLDRNAHVPLLVYGPRPAGLTKQIDQPVELVDLFPTFASLAGAMVPAGLRGQVLTASPFEEDADAVAWVEFGDMLAVRQGHWLFSMRAFFHHGCSLDPELTERLMDSSPNGASYGLHDVVADPWQKRNVAPDDPRLAAEMRAIMIRIRSGPGAPDEEATRPDRLWELRMTQSQGYW